MPPRHQAHSAKKCRRAQEPPPMPLMPLPDWNPRMPPEDAELSGSPVNGDAAVTKNRC